MLTPTVILLLILSKCHDAACGFMMYKYPRAVDSRQFFSQQSTSDSGSCSSIFQYQNDENGNLVGAVTVDQINSNGRVQLDIELSVGNRVEGFSGKIVLVENKQKVIEELMNRRPILYRVLFPAWQNIPPKVTKISINGNLKCTGPGISLQTVPILTTINLQHKLSLGITPLTSSSNSGLDDNVKISFGNQDNQNPQQTFVIRKDNAGGNTIFIDVSPTTRPKDSSNPSLNTKNPFNFNPNNRPSSTNSGQINPQNPFLSGLTTTGLPRGDSKIQISSNNPFFNQRTEIPPVVFQPTNRPPPRVETSGVAIKGDTSEICGRPLPTNSLVFNGERVARGAYPWLVAIFQQFRNVTISYMCCGSLISDRHVVTAAHCVKTDYKRLREDEVLCVFGKLNIKKWVTSQWEIMLEPELITIHPYYKPGSANADIAVMSFADRIPFNRMIRPLCLWRESSDLNRVVGNIGSVVGWGRDERGESSTDEPRVVNMPIVGQFECTQGSSKTVGQAFVQIVSQNTFCAGFRNRSGPCNGDSGSAFLLNRDGVFYMRGIVSTSLSDSTYKTCNLDEYVVFVDASKYIDWLIQIIRET